MFEEQFRISPHEHGGSFEKGLCIMVPKSSAHMRQSSSADVYEIFTTAKIMLFQELDAVIKKDEGYAGNAE